MFRALASLAAVFALLVTTGCSGAVPWNSQNEAGVTTAYVELDTCTNAEGVEYACVKEARVVDGKEKSDVKLDITYPIGDDKVITLSYAASGVAAFDGQSVRAAVEKAVSEDTASTLTPEAITAIVEAITGAL